MRSPFGISAPITFRSCTRRAIKPKHVPKCRLGFIGRAAIRNSGKSIRYPRGNVAGD